MYWAQFCLQSGTLRTKAGEVKQDCYQFPTFLASYLQCVEQLTRSQDSAGTAGVIKHLPSIISNCIILTNTK